MPDVYISRAGMETKAADEKFTLTELSSVRAELVELEQSVLIKDERIRQLEAKQASMQETVTAVAEALALRPGVAELKDALSRQRQRSKSEASVRLHRH